MTRLHIHRAERADRLVDALGDLLLAPLADPFATEIVSVPTQGVERWLSQSLSHRLGISGTAAAALEDQRGDGVAAGIDFPSLHRLTARVLDSVLAVDGHRDPWQPRRSVWPLLSIIDQAINGGAITEPRFSILASHLGVDSDIRRRGRRYGTARHLANLFASYASQRPEMVQAWIRGADLDGSGRPVAADLAWQPELLRRLRAEIGTPGPAERIDQACELLAGSHDAADLPDRISIFGPTRLCTEHRRILTALAEHRDVHLWVTNASPALWESIRQESIRQESMRRESMRRESILEEPILAESISEHLGPPPPCAGRPRSEDRTITVARHRLLSYLGRDSRELQLTLLTDSPGAIDHHYRPEEAPAAPATLLDQLQADIAADIELSPLRPKPALHDHDRSIQVHASHGPDRQVEVLREVLLGLLADDPTLEPRDIVVMCPDIETFAPLISASFGLAEDGTDSEHPGHLLRVRLADRSLRQLNPLLAILSRLLEMTDARLEASVVLDLLASPPVAAKFRLSEDDLDRARDLIHRSGVRWGLNPAHRARFQLGGFGQNTWEAGLDRLLLGVTMSEEGQHFIGTALPLDDVDSSDVELVGRLAEFIDRIRLILASFSPAKPLAEWVVACKQALESLTSVPVKDQWQVGHAYAELADLDGLDTTRLTNSATDPPGDPGEPEAADAVCLSPVLLSLSDLQTMLADTFRGRPSRANFRTGTLTMCTMTPMRSVPHRVICVLGLDDGVFPRAGAAGGDDLLAIDPCVGDRDPRSEDRQLLLDAIMAAGEHLIIVYSGADPRTNASRPPAVPLGELLDTLDLTADAKGDTVRSRLVVHHPLQPFDRKNFTPSGLMDAAGSFSFDPAALRGAQASLGVREPPPAVYDPTPLDPLPVADLVPLTDLIRFFQHPVKAYLRTRAGLYAADADEDNIDEMPIALDGLQKWAIGDRLLRHQLRGRDPAQLMAAEWRRGEVPAREFGRRTLEPIGRKVEGLIAASGPYLEAPRSSQDVHASVGPYTVTGTIADLHDQTIVSVHYSWLGAKHRLQAWLQLLALTVSQPGTPWRAVSIGQGATSVLGVQLDAGYACRALSDLVELYWLGMCEPLPMPPKTAADYAEIRFQGRDAGPLLPRIAKDSWQRECDPAWSHFFGPATSMESLLSAPAQPGEAIGTLGEPTRFGTLARRVWEPLLRKEGE